MADTATTPPSQLRAGDSLRWLRTLPDYPASDGWVLKYQLVTTTSVQTITAAAAGADHLVDVTASTTAGWVAGLYSVQEYVTKGTERHTICVTQLRVLTNLAANTTGMDVRTHARKVLDAIEAWLESKAPVAGSMEIAGRKLSNYPITDLLALRDRYRNEVAREEAVANGSRRGTKLLVRF